VQRGGASPAVASDEVLLAEVPCDERPTDE